MKAIKSIKLLLIACAVAIAAMGAVVISCEAAQLPDHIYVSGSRDASIANKPYIELVADAQTAGVLFTANDNYEVTAMLFGILPLKEIRVTRVGSEYVEICGRPVGIRLYSDGVVVSGLSVVDTDSGGVNPGELCGLRSGDVIRTIDGNRITCAYDMLNAVENSQGHVLTLSVIRADGTVEDIRLTPAFSKNDGCWRAGIWVRETSSGLGTLTFITLDTSQFGGLGHAICDADSGAQIQIYGGDLMSAELTGVIPGSKGIPGELVGVLGDERLGSVSANNESGVYGQYLSDTSGYQIVRVAMKQELREGDAKILTTLPGSDKPDLFNCTIERINYDADNPSRNLIVRITDDRLLSTCGGIVQGMSGSPIIQNGAFAAALTHVFVGDPAMGYAIFAENMYSFVGVQQDSTNLAA